MTRKELEEAALEIMSCDMSVCFEHTDEELMEMIKLEDTETLIEFLEENRE